MEHPLDGMDPTSRQEVHRIIREARSDLGQAYFRAVASAAGSDPRLLDRWAPYFQPVLKACNDPHWAWRAAGALRRSHGDWSGAASAFRRAGRLATDEAQRLTFPIGAIDSLARAGSVRSAVRLGRRLARELDRRGDHTAAARARLNTGNALLWQDRYAGAIRTFEMALPHLRDVESAAALLGLSTAELFGGDPSVARDYAERALEAFLSLGADAYADLCRINLAQAHILTGRADEARLLLLDLRPRLGGSERARCEEFLGDAYAALNLDPEALEAYRSARKRVATPLNRANLDYGIGRVSASARRLRAAQKSYDELGNLAWKGAAEIELYRLAAGPLPDESGLGPRHRCDRALLLGDDASALALCRRHGFVDLEWKALEIAAQRRGRLNDYRKMFRAMLAARALVRSTTSRARFLSDKHDALRSYLDRLLMQPTRVRVREALRVISQSRAVALADEILAQPGAHSEAFIREIEALRSKLTRPESPGNTRRGTSDGGFQRARRVWAETIVRLCKAVEPKSDQEHAVAYQVGKEACRRLAGDTCATLNLDPSTLPQRLDALSYELLAPMAHPGEPPDRAVEQLRLLGQALFEGLDASSDWRISPDEDLWSAPWQACASVVLEGDPTLILAAHPSMGAGCGACRLPKRPRVCIWQGAASDLPEVLGEVDALRQAFPDAEVCASLPEVVASLGQTYDLLHVATHGRLNASNPMFSTLEFAGGPLFACEVASSRLRADIVTLSACDTGKIAPEHRLEPDGIVRAFLARGAKGVVGSMWPLDDLTARIMMSRLATDLAAGSTLAPALARARRCGREMRPHPYFWASLVLFGGHRPL